MTKKEINLCIEMQDMFRKAMGIPQWGDRFLSPEGKEYTLLPESFKMNEFWEDQLKGHAWLPKSIDSETPERGLWGMIDWDRWWVHAGNGIFEIDDPQNHFEGPIPTKALLLALKAQKET